MKIEKNDDLIPRSWLLGEIEHDLGCFEIENAVKPGEKLVVELGGVIKMILAAPKADAVQLPCKIGDFVWAIRHYKGVAHPQKGMVTEMLFTKSMKLHIVVSHIARGEWGKTVFGSYKEAEKAIKEGKA